MKKQIQKHKFLFSLLLLTLVIIWGNSCMPPKISGDESSFVLRLFDAIFGPGLFTEFAIRKLAHFTEYAILSIELGLFLDGQLRLQLLCSFFIAFFDETIQIFSGRGSQIQDVWIDFAGAFTGAILLLLIQEVIKYLRQKGTLLRANSKRNK